MIWNYVKAGNLAYFVLVVLFHLLFSAGTVGTNLWLSEWTNDVPINGTIPIEHAKMWFGGYGGFVAFQGIFNSSTDRYIHQLKINFQMCLHQIYNIGIILDYYGEAS